MNTTSCFQVTLFASGLSARLPVRVRAALAAGLVIGGSSFMGLGLGGCQRYEPKPLDLSAHAAAFVLRTPASALEQPLGNTAGSSSADARVGGSAGGAGGFDLADGVGLAEAEAVAMVFNADLRIARLRAGVAAASAEHAGLWADPSIGVDLTRIVQNVAEPWKLAASVGFTLPISGRLEAEKALAEADRQVELMRVVEREWAVRMDLRRTWYEWSALREQHSVTEQFVRRMDELLSVIDLMEQAGEMPRIEARLFRIEGTSARGDLAALEAQASLARGRVLRLMGLSPKAGVSLIQTSGIAAAIGSDGTVMHSARAPNEASDSDAIARHDNLIRRSPRLRVALHEYEAAERAIAREVRGQYPDLHIGPGYGREDGNDQVLLGLSLPLPLWNANRRGVAEADAGRTLAGAVAQTTLEALIAELDAAITRWRSAQAQLAILLGDVAPMVEAQDADIRRLAELGEVNTLVLLESLTRRQSVSLRLIEAQRDEAIAAIDVEELVGPDWSETKDPLLLRTPAVPALHGAESKQEVSP